MILRFSPTLRGTVARAAGVGIVAGIATTLVLAAVGGVGTNSARADEPPAVTTTTVAQDPDAANAPFPDLAVTVSQTTGLISQGVTVSWTGGKRSTPPSSANGGENFLQIAQCWGEDKANPGHADRTTCQYGAFNTPGATRDGYVADGTSISEKDDDYTAPAIDVFTPAYTSVPFRSVTGEVVASVEKKKQLPVNVNVNNFFNPSSSNEVPWAGSATNGAGSVKFEIQTALQANGLGCGTPTGADAQPQSCWLVVIPRGTADAGEQHITQSGLRWDAWKHALSFKLSFKPLGVTCSIGAAERQLRGSELVATAVSSWQPVLCTSQGGATYTMSNGAESDAAGAANGTDPAPLALTSRALSSGDQDDLRYAPVAVGGLAVAFALDHSPVATDGTPAEQADKTGLSFDSMKLTPRLIAKLLTASYTDALPTYADKSGLGKNARNLLLDPDFLEVNADNPDWQYQAIVAPSVSDLLVPQGRSDAAWQLWRYVLADQDAVSFLQGKPDKWGMSVNKHSSINPKVNPDGGPLELPRDDFPKADPVVQPPSAAGGEVNLVTWRPYTNDLDQAAYFTLRGDGQTLGLWDPSSAPPKYGKSVRSLPGYQRVLALTDTSSAAKYQVVTAQLRNAAGQFVAPTQAGLTAAAAVMTPVAGQKQVVEYDPAGAAAKTATTAYPLTMPVYAATNPAQGDSATRADYAAFIRYAATTGQTPGVDPGNLPPGYAPIPADWKAQAIGAAAAIQSGASITPPPSGGDESVPGDSGGGGGFGGDTSLGDGGGATTTDTHPATGEAAGSLSGGRTAKDPDTGGIAAIVPGGVIGGLVAAASVPIIGRMRRFP
ncbi:hypothetical protein [Leifsonia poae]|uniref:hypothetical protein n=1 Tax=Leifsonia poae TaxID=110933 RepID=UPI001CBD4EFB|nr:hypothetical protein [Leifsonia poae]